MSEPEIIPTDQGKTATSARKFTGLIEAISQIQELSVMERAKQEIPKDFFTIEQWLKYFHAGFGNGLLEGLLFGFVTAATLPLLYDPVLAVWAGNYFPLVRSKLFLLFLNCLPLIITVVICSHLGRIPKKKLTWKATISLLSGRSFCLIIKGILIYVAFIFCHRWLTEDNIQWLLTSIALIKNESLAEDVYRIIYNLRPHLIPTAYLTLGIFSAAMLTPYFTTWIISLYRSSKEKKAAAFWLAN